MTRCCCELEHLRRPDDALPHLGHVDVEEHAVALEHRTRARGRCSVTNTLLGSLTFICRARSCAPFWTACVSSTSIDRMSCAPRFSAAAAAGVAGAGGGAPATARRRAAP